LPARQRAILRATTTGDRETAMYNWRGRIGMLLPSTNSVAEPQIQGMLPDGVTFHTTRLKLKGSREADIMGMIAGVEDGAKLLADASPDLIVFHCTAASMFKTGLDDEIIGRIERATGLPATSTSKAVLDALRTLGARRIALTTPYIQETNAREVAFLESHQITVLSETGMGIAGDGLQMAAVEPGTWYRRVTAQQDSAADAYFISCTAIRSAEVIEPLERDLERPVVTSNQAMVWHTLKTVGVRERRPGYGRLMAALGARSDRRGE
jgi:maleate isomerase